MNIPFIKAQGAGNDFLFTYERDLPGALDEERLRELAKAICARHTGLGAEGCAARIRLYNSDGSPAELSGNGTRCAAAILVDAGWSSPEVRIQTGSGPKQLRVVERGGRRFRFEMDMGRPRKATLGYALRLAGEERQVTILDVGNPQCAAVVDSLEFDWKKLGAEIEKHSDFPNRTNVSFVRKMDEHTIEARFYERGAGPTLSSGTGSTGAAAAAVLLGLVKSPVRVETEAGPLDLRWEDSRESGSEPIEGLGKAPAGSIYLTGPAEITAQGDYFW